MPSLTSEQELLLTEFKDVLDSRTLGQETRLEKLEDTVRLLKQRGLVQLPGRATGNLSNETQGELAGRKFVTSEAFKAWAGSPGLRGRVAVGVALSTKAAVPIISSDVAPPATIRLPDIATPMFPPPGMLSLLPTRPTTSDKVNYLRLKARPTPGARSQFPEGSAKAEQSFDVGPIEVDVATIAAWTSASTQALADTSQLERFIDTTLSMLVLDENGSADLARNRTKRW